MSKDSKIKLAREFRKNSTRSERMLWSRLRGNSFLGLKFRRQHLIEGFIVDFYCHSLKLVIEIDGDVHKYQEKEDAERQKIIKAKGNIFYRMNTEEIEDNIENVLNNLKLLIEKKVLS